MWYLERYLKMSDTLRIAYQLKEAYQLWFEEAKDLGPSNLTAVKERLYEFYNLVKASGFEELWKPSKTGKKRL